MRQYVILYKRGGSDFTRLERFSHAALYDRPEVQDAINLMRDRPALEGAAIRLGDELYNITSFNQEAEAPRAFRF